MAIRRGHRKHPARQDNHTLLYEYKRPLCHGMAKLFERALGTVTKLGIPLSWIGIDCCQGFMEIEGVEINSLSPRAGYTRSQDAHVEGIYPDVLRTFLFNHRNMSLPQPIEFWVDHLSPIRTLNMSVINVVTHVRYCNKKRGPDDRSP